MKIVDLSGTRGASIRKSRAFATTNAQALRGKVEAGAQTVAPFQLEQRGREGRNAAPTASLGAWLAQICAKLVFWEEARFCGNCSGWPAAAAFASSTSRASAGRAMCRDLGIDPRDL